MFRKNHYNMEFKFLLKLWLCTLFLSLSFSPPLVFVRVHVLPVVFALGKIITDWSNAPLVNANQVLDTIFVVFLAWSQVRLSLCEAVRAGWRYTTCLRRQDRNHLSVKFGFYLCRKPFYPVMSRWMYLYCNSLCLSALSFLISPIRLLTVLLPDSPDLKSGDTCTLTFTAALFTTSKMWSSLVSIYTVYRWSFDRTEPGGAGLSFHPLGRQRKKYLKFRVVGV